MKPAGSSPEPTGPVTRRPSGNSSRATVGRVDRRPRLIRFRSADHLTVPRAQVRIVRKAGWNRIRRARYGAIDTLCLGPHRPTVPRARRHGRSLRCAGQTGSGESCVPIQGVARARRHRPATPPLRPSVRSETGGRIQEGRRLSRDAAWNRGQRKHGMFINHIHRRLSGRPAGPRVQ